MCGRVTLCLDSRFVFEEYLLELAAQHRSAEGPGASGQGDQDGAGDAGAREVRGGNDDACNQNRQRHGNADHQNPSPGARRPQDAEDHGDDGDGQGGEQRVGLRHGLHQDVERAATGAEKKREEREEEWEAFRLGGWRSM